MQHPPSKPAARAKREGDRRRAKKNADPHRVVSHPPDPGLKPTRLNKVIAQSGLCSRRDADISIAAGEVTVNGKPAALSGQLVIPAKDVILHAGRPLPKVKAITLLMNKPKGVVTTKDDDLGRKTVLDLLPPNLRSVDPAGRLDRDSYGALLLTNDGALLYRLTHPSFHLPKCYRVTVNHPLAHKDAQKLLDGVLLQPENVMATVETVELETPTILILTLVTGYNRQIRRTLEQLGYKVTALKRTQIGPLRLGPLPSGQHRFLTESELISLRKATRKKLIPTSAETSD